MENLMNVVGKLATKIFNVNIITKYENDIKFSIENNNLTYLELGTYLLTHDINLIEITEIIEWLIMIILKIIIKIQVWILIILNILWISLFYFTSLRYIPEFIILGIFILILMVVLIIIRGLLWKKRFWE